jgi:hypothetical protein
LKDHWAELLTEDIHRFQKLRKFSVALREDLSCAMICGTLTEKMKPSGVLAAQLPTMRADGHA